MCSTINHSIASECSPNATIDAQMNQSEVEWFEATQNQITQKITKVVLPKPTNQFLVATPSPTESNTAMIGDAANGNTIHGILCACASGGHAASAPITRKSVVARLLMTPTVLNTATQTVLGLC